MPEDINKETTSGATEVVPAVGAVDETATQGNGPNAAVFPGVCPREEVSGALAVGMQDSGVKLSVHDGEESGVVNGTEGTATLVGNDGVAHEAEAGCSPVETHEVSPVATHDIPDVKDGALPSVRVASCVDVKGDGVRVVSLPAEIRLPNFTLGRSSSFVWKIPEGIRFAHSHSQNDNVLVKAEKDELSFTPAESGEMKIPLVYNDSKVVVFRMTINPDPWSLWPNPPPPVNLDEVVFDSDQDRLDSNHKDTISETHLGLRVIGASRRGRSHERSGTFRDDDMGVWSDAKNRNYVFIVSDGAGSCKYSREGAFQSICCIQSKLEDNKDKVEQAWLASKGSLKPDCHVGMLLAQLALKAREELTTLSTRMTESGRSCKIKDFSATLLMAALKIDSDGGARLVTFSIGDGAIAWRNADNKFELMCRPDSGEFGGGTRFLVTPEVWKTIFYPRKDIPWTWNSFCESRVMCREFSADEAKGLQIYLMSDGVSDPWFETDARLEDANEWHKFATDTLLKSGVNKAALDLNASPKENAEKLWEWLYFKIIGNHDDRTMIMAYTMDDNAKEVSNV